MRRSEIMASRTPASFSHRTFHLAFYDVATAAFAPALAILTRGISDSQTSNLSSLTYWAISFLFTIALLAYCGIGAELRQYCAPSDVQKLFAASIGAVVLTLAAVFSIDRLEGVARAVPILHCAYLFFGF